MTGEGCQAKDDVTFLNMISKKNSKQFDFKKLVLLLSDNVKPRAAKAAEGRALRARQPDCVWQFYYKEIK